MNWPWSDLLTDVVLTSVGGLGVKGRGEGVVWVGPQGGRARTAKVSKSEGVLLPNLLLRIQHRHRERPQGVGADSKSQQK